MNPYVIIGLLVAWISSLGTVGYWQNMAGHTAEKAVWQQRDNDELRAANTRIHDLEEEARALEQRHATELAGISADYQKDLANAKAQKDRDAAAVRAGALSLRINTPCKDADRGEAGKAAAGASGRDAAATTELPREVTAGLFELADDADEVVRQLTACQKIVVEDRNEKRATGP